MLIIIFFKYCLEQKLIIVIHIMPVFAVTPCGVVIYYNNTYTQQFYR